jgi:hypothetical protein
VSLSSSPSLRWPHLSGQQVVDSSPLTHGVCVFLSGPNNVTWPCLDLSLIPGNVMSGNDHDKPSLAAGVGSLTKLKGIIVPHRN